MTDHQTHLDAVLDNFTATVKNDRFARGTVQSVLEGILRDITRTEADMRPKELVDILNATRNNMLTVTGWRESLWLQRIYSVFTEANGWKAFGNDLGATIQEIDSSEYVPTLSIGASVYYYSTSTNEALEVSRGPYDTDVFIHSNDPVNEKISRFVDMVELPDPFEGRIVKLSKDGAEIIDLHIEGLQDYAPDAEAAIKWMGSIASPQIRANLDAADLEPRAGLLLEGPPGSGKTTLAKREAVRHAGGATVLYPSSDMPADEIFDFAERYEVSLVILEDVESFFGTRGGSTFSDFLNALDGASDSSGIMVLATTNDSSDFDDAIRRPGRLERRAVITSIHEGFMRDLLGQRLSYFATKDLDALAVAAQARAVEAKANLTPALADSVARAIIMGSMTSGEAIEFVRWAWQPSYEGVSYVG